MKLDEIEKACDILNNGGIVIFPTDTAFGVGCRIDNVKSIERLFEIRKRPESQATPVLFNSIKMVEDYLLPIQPDVYPLMKTHWPGALTIVLPCKLDKVPSLVRGGGTNLGVRIPDHEIPLELIRRINTPILGPSANFHGANTPFSYSDIDPAFIELVDFSLTGETKDEKNVSTIIDCSTRPWKVLRKGMVIV